MLPTVFVADHTPLCKPDCAGLCSNCGANLNEGPCNCDKEDVDPRFAALRSLKNELSEE